MKLVQVYDPKKGIQAGKLEEDKVYPVAYEEKGVRSLLDLVQYASAVDMELPEVVDELASKEPLPLSWELLNATADLDRPHLAIPIHPPEVWACGVTYKKSAEFRDEDTQTSKGIYDYVYFAKRPELFFKGRAGHCTGTNDFIGLRNDSKFTAVEPELAVLIDGKRKVLGYMVANDVSAWDIERENPLYLPQSKIFRGCCALGPVLVTADTVPDPYKLKVSCTIRRGTSVLFSGETTVGMMKRRIEELIDFLFLANTVPDGTVLLTGTGIIQTEEAALQENDVVEITVPEIGTLRNVARRIS
ncbi:MAG: fumarylacetoacetate hydrolase family protein [Acidobacteria bacterium]|nr:fumarylacetoacetate hydrolase family protein [Acidobacteriota bacterium]MCI0623080.1 fumarylacetoacetate hydrolase family protein [Acidobacteriota bacterium]MCI0721846.1 fumarylacetoacetate hydrolase family protein [Acidobacteriota bacterium]